MKLIFLISFILLSSALLSQSEIKDDKFFTVAEVEPEFPGGIKELYKFIAGNFKYPVNANHERFNSKFRADFIVEKDGMITNIAFNDVDEYSQEQKEEMIRVIKLMPNWKPASQNGLNVRFLYKLAFTINIKVED